MKWYARATDDDPTRCSACGGVLDPLPAPAILQHEDDFGRECALDAAVLHPAPGVRRTG